MRAMVLDGPGQPLRLAELPCPVPQAGQLLLAVQACGVCRTDLHLRDGDLPDAVWPLVPGHEIVARVAGLGPGVRGWRRGQRVGVPWLGWTCGHCRFCTSGRENLCVQVCGGDGWSSVGTAKGEVNGRPTASGFGCFKALAPVHQAP